MNEYRTHNTDETLRAPRIRVAPIVVRDHALLLVRHVKGDRTYWLLPGGGVDYGETLGEALLREIKEETNLDTELGELVMVNDSIPPDGHRHVVNLYFTARVTGGELRKGAESNLAELRFVPCCGLSPSKNSRPSSSTQTSGPGCCRPSARGFPARPCIRAICGRIRLGDNHEPCMHWIALHMRNRTR